jgi:uncharacterized protein with HEPN domain
MKKEFLDYVEDIINAMIDAQQFVEGMEFEDFLEDKKTVFAVLRALEIIGEATKNIPVHIRDRFPQIPWKEMAGMRDKVIHEYFGVDLRRVWNTTKNDLPALKSEFERVLEESEKKHSLP